MARERKLFGPGAFADAIIGNFFVAVSDVDSPPAGWSKMDGGFIPGGGLSTFPNLTGTYLRGGNFLDLIERGSVEHIHTWPSTTSDIAATVSHVTGSSVGAVNVTSPAQISIVINHIHAFPAHPASDHEHTHQIQNVVEANVTPSGKVLHLPETQVINWIGRQLTVNELKVLDKGTIFGFMGTIAEIPAEWAHANGQNGTPDIRNRLIRCGDALATEGSDLHRSKHDYPSDSAGTHAHVVLGETQSQGALLIAGVFVPATPHTHPLVGIGDHAQKAASTQDSSDEIDLKPPHRAMIFIQKIAAADPILIDTTAIGVHVLFNPNELSPGVLWTSVSGPSDKFEDKYLVGRKFGDTNFGNLGPIGALQHQHTVDYGTTTDGVHTHVINGTAPGVFGSATGTSQLPTPGHDHGTTSDGGHDHPTTGSVGVLGDNKPATIELKLFKKVL